MNKYANINVVSIALSQFYITLSNTSVNQTYNVGY